MKPSRYVQVKKIWYIVLYVLYWFVLFEGASRILLQQKNIIMRLHAGDESSYRLLWMNWFRKYRRPFEYGYDAYDPVLGWRMKAHVRELKDDDTEVITNSRGIRSLREYAYNKPKKIRRVLVLGDSFTFGEEVENDKVYPYLIERMLPRTEVINMGVRGYGTDQMLLYLKEEGLKYNPDIVMLGFIADDMRRNIVSFLDVSKPRFQLIDGRLILTNVPTPTPRQVAEAEWFRLKIIDLFLMTYHKLTWQKSIRKQEGRRMTEAIMGEMVRTIENNHAAAVFVYIPMPSEVRNPTEDSFSDEKFLLDYCRRKQIVCTTLRPAIVEAIRQGRNMRLHGHWDKEGHAVIAEALERFLKNFLLN